MIRLELFLKSKDIRNTCCVIDLAINNLHRVLILVVTVQVKSGLRRSEHTARTCSSAGFLFQGYLNALNPVHTCSAHFPRNRYHIGLQRVAGREGGDTTETNEGSAIPPLLRAWKQRIDHEMTLT